MKRIVGIASPAALWGNDISNDDRYNFCNNYGKRVREEMEKTGREGDPYPLYEQMVSELLVRAENHYPDKFWRNASLLTKHPIDLMPDSRIRTIPQQEQILVTSFHNYRINNPSKQLVIAATAEDGTIEAVEYGGKILGVQFHPECDSALNQLFRAVLMEE